MTRGDTTELMKNFDHDLSMLAVILLISLAVLAGGTSAFFVFNRRQEGSVNRSSFNALTLYFFLSRHVQ